MKVGIDLGTCNTEVVELNGVNTKNIDIEMLGRNILPSVLHYRNGQLNVGTSAKNRANTDPEHCIIRSKIHMGTNKQWTIDGRSFKPEDVAQELFKKIYTVLKRSAPDEDIIADITVPACFIPVQIELTKKAAEYAGIKVKNMVPEPIAAARAESAAIMRSARYVFVLDVGGGTSDISVVENDHSAGSTKVIAVGGSDKMGGGNYDDVIVRKLLKPMVLSQNPDVGNADSRHMIRGDRKLEEIAAEEVKTHFQNEMEYKNDFIYDIFDAYGIIGDATEVKISYAEYRAATQECTDIIKGLVKSTLDDLSRTRNIKASDIDAVILVGGMAWERSIREMLGEFFPENKLRLAKNPMTSIALGAAMYVNDHNNTVPAMLSVDIGVWHRDPKTNKREFCCIIPRETVLNSAYTVTRPFTNNRRGAESLRVCTGIRRYKGGVAMEPEHVEDIIIKVPRREAFSHNMEIQITVNNNREMSVRVENKESHAVVQKELVWSEKR